jgi:hypothetical protein
MLDITRNQVLLAGLVVLALGLQLLLVDTYQLTPEFTQFLAEQTDHPVAAVNGAAAALTNSGEPIAKKTLQPPDWIGWALISLGSVLILHSMGMKRPD